MPGQGLDEKLRDLLLNEGLDYIVPAGIAWALVVGSIAQLVSAKYPVHLIFLGLALALTIWGAFRFARVVKLAKSYKLGRQGERHVGQLLQSLDVPGTRVFHDIPGDAFNLDHVVVCDRGIYVVETKTWSKSRGQELEVRNGKIFLRGRPVPGNAIGQAAGAARWLRKLIEAETGHIYECQPVVVLPGWFVKPMDAATKEVAWVLEPKALLKWIPKAPLRLTPEEIRRIEAAIARHVRRSLPDGSE